MASASFRDSINSLGWSRRPEPARIESSNSGFFTSLRSMNPFGGDSYVQLPSSEAGTATAQPPPIQEEGGLFNLSRWDRILIFAGCNIGALVCFSLCLVFLFFPVLLTKPRKFATLWSLGSALFIGSWAALMGLMPYIRHLLSGPRLPFTGVYFGSIALTLYFSVGLHSTVLTLISSIMQIIALLWYLVSYFPGGSQTLRFASGFAGNRVMGWMNG
ncbi:protein transport protein sft2 [Ascosphaera pollenicola]|nr:protein transport protein sft2 [Ascosphaera pollenicola]